VRLRERRAAIEQGLLARVHAVSDPALVEDPAYALGLREAVAAALDFGIASLEASAAEPLPVPEAVLSQARAAARNGVSLDVVIRRYSGGYTLLGDFIAQEAEASGPLAAAELRRLLRLLSTAFDHLVAAVACAYSEEAKSRFQTAERRRGEWVSRLLAGDLVDPEQLGYELESWHLGALACGSGAVEALRELSRRLDRSLLLVRAGAHTAWAWLGGAARLSPCEALRQAEAALPQSMPLALGEPGRGVEGWRLTHRQAKAAMSIARRDPGRRARYGDVALLTSVLRDEVLLGSLNEMYLAPLEEDRDRGAALIETLHAYFAAGHNASSAAAALGVTRQTVSIRLRRSEERIGRPLGACTPELETALRLRDLDSERRRAAEGAAG